MVTLPFPRGSRNSAGGVLGRIEHLPFSIIMLCRVGPKLVSERMPDSAPDQGIAYAGT
jgi:hypothetical protein